MNSATRAMNSFLPASLTKLNSPSANNSMNLSSNAASIAANLGSNMGSNSVKSQNSHAMWIAAAVLVFLGIFAYYYHQFSESVNNWYESLSAWMSGEGPLDAQLKPQEPAPALPAPLPPPKPVGTESIVENILPPAKEVFTVSKNDYSYYDAAPLCKALGAELATYDEVKQAWKKGADWCNYGWVKGQMAVYPTQKGTYEELQQGPEEQKGACGRPGVNGGYFDNPELKFGVTCSGVRPAKGAHDASANLGGSPLPLTGSGLEFEKKVQQFKSEAETVGIMPFSREKWSS